MPDADWARLGALLTRRRVDLDRRYRNRQVFADERQINYYLALAIERAKRQNFEPQTLAALEIAYDLEPGAIDRALHGGDLVLSQPSPAAGSSATAADSPSGDIDLDELKLELKELREELSNRLTALEAQEWRQRNGPERRAG